MQVNTAVDSRFGMTALQPQVSSGVLWSPALSDAGRAEYCHTQGMAGSVATPASNSRTTHTRRVLRLALRRVHQDLRALLEEAAGSARSFGTSRRVVNRVSACHMQYRLFRHSTNR